jgi:NAD(P)-dependent dehydrogenase (short-subunit alcohol dehydrogenase family)
LRDAACDRYAEALQLDDHFGGSRAASRRNRMRACTPSRSLMDTAATGQAAADVASRFAVTHVVHNAGAVRPALLPDVEQDDLQALSQLHLGAAIALVQAALPSMKKNNFGRVVLMSSRGALGLATRTAYVATKAGMVGMARTWALELASEGITVNVVAPGLISDTEMFRSIVPEDSEREKALAAAIPVKRLGRSDDVARAVMFFCDPASGFVTARRSMSAVERAWVRSSSEIMPPPAVVKPLGAAVRTRARRRGDRIRTLSDAGDENCCLGQLIRKLAKSYQMRAVMLLSKDALLELPDASEHLICCGRRSDAEE